MQLRRWATKKLAKDQVQSIWHQYNKDFIDNVANDRQRKESWTKNKSRAEARLKKLCGSSMMAKVIWLVGLPNISERDSTATATETILNWLSMLAKTIQDHKATPTYQEHARKSGTQKNKSGLTERELLLKKEKKRAARWKYAGKPSTASGSNIWHAPAHWQCHGDTWEAPAQWQWHGDTWQAPAQWQWQPHGY